MGYLKRYVCLGQPPRGRSKAADAPPTDAARAPQNDVHFFAYAKAMLQLNQASRVRRAACAPPTLVRAPRPGLPAAGMTRQR